MSGRGPIVNSLILLAATGFLSACNAHHHNGGTVYRPHHDGVRTGPVRTRTHTTTRTTVVAPHRDRYRDNRYRRGDPYPRQGHPNAPATAKRPNPPAHGLYGTQPGQLKRETGPNNPAKNTARATKRQIGKPALLGSQKQSTKKQPSSILKKQATPPKSSALTHQPRTKSGLPEGKQPNAEHRKGDTSGS